MPAARTQTVRARASAPYAKTGVKNRKRQPKEEFPMLAPLGLMVEKTKGSGNCLFHAVSKQIYGSDKYHAKVRSDVVKFMSENEENFKYHIVAKAGGGTRSSCRRSTRAASPVFDPEAIDKSWRNYLAEMKQEGTYADNLEIVAVSAVYGKTVQIFTGEKTKHSIMWGDIPGSNGTIRIAHHSYQHFSAVIEIKKPVEEGVIEIEKPVEESD